MDESFSLQLYWGLSCFLWPTAIVFVLLPTTNYQLQFTHDLDRCLQWLVRSSCRQFGRPSSCNSGSIAVISMGPGSITVIIRGHLVWNTQALIWGIHGHKKKAAITTFVNHLRYLDYAGCRFKPCWNVFAVVWLSGLSPSLFLHFVLSIQGKSLCLSLKLGSSGCWLLQKWVAAAREGVGS